MEIDFEKRNDEVVYTFDKIPTSMEDLADVDQYLDEPSFAPALFLMISGLDKSFYKDRFMDGKYYKPFSYIDGATPDNNYVPKTPYVIHVYNDPNGPQEENYKSFLLQSSGSDSKRKAFVRIKPSVGLWYLTEEMLLSDIKEPVKDDAWA